MNRYSFNFEITDDTYLSLLNWSSAKCVSGLFVVRDIEKMSGTAKNLIKELASNLLDDYESSEWPGTILLGSSAHVYKFSLDVNVIKVLIKYSSSFADWQTPKLPEDLCLFRYDEEPLLVTITHEGWGELYLNDNEKKELEYLFPEITPLKAF